MRRVGKGFSGVDTPLFDGMLVAQEVGEDADEVHAEDVNVVAEGVASDDVNAVVDKPSIPSPPPPNPPPQPSQDIPSTSQDARISMDLIQNLMDTCTTLSRRVEHLELDKIAQALEITKLKQRVKKLERRNKLKEEESEPAKLQKVVDVVTTVKIITEVVIVASDTIIAASTTITAADVPIPTATIAAAPTLTAAPSKRRKGVTKEEMDEEDSRTLKRLNESQEEKAAKKQKLDEEVEELKRHLQIMPNDDDDDVYTEATPLALKVPIVDYDIYNQNNKPYYKIKRADGSHQLYLSFLSLLRNFDREDLEALWRLVKERFATTKPKNFSDDFLLITLGAMFEKPDIHAQIWKNQKSVHGQAKVKSRKMLESCGVQIITFTTTQLILLVEKRYPLIRFTLDQMLNNVRLEIKEESEASLELMRFIRQQHQEGA
nr:hypothetical protein [Tanacetum cinerariifolium]